ncbi:sterol desaturase family protein [Vibrio sp. SCSIO 43136]|uniref:sterol desaturase family protein n=1 Tax=Vibrio sp. SCSIO 43136 TaxID=2819101 RepID=UPI0020750591|nr:sterol desaturase family protein [Vibrio sp. SCSIO 43136]USD66586.1 sterol desaturase family protein [Vibrio sp. SCSIO 43136]
MDTIRFGVFLFVLVACAMWEYLKPRKALTQSKWQRWLNNLGLVGFNSIVLTITMPLLAFETAQMAQNNQWGLLNIASAPIWLNIVVTVVVLDLVIYWQHRWFHRNPWLWRLHRMHHADQDIDVTTGARFHPIEIILSMWIKILAVVALGASPLAVVVFEILLNASAMFNHSNAKLPLSVDKVLRKVVVTPDMHRVHHSVIVKETHSNFGFFLSVWDRWFSSYIAQPALGHDDVEIGIPIFRKRQEQNIWHMLTQPFRDT